MFKKLLKADSEKPGTSGTQKDADRPVIQFATRSNLFIHYGIFSLRFGLMHNKNIGYMKITEVKFKSGIKSCLYLLLFVRYIFRKKYLFQTEGVIHKFTYLFMID